MLATSFLSYFLNYFISNNAELLVLLYVQVYCTRDKGDVRKYVRM